MYYRFTKIEIIYTEDSFLICIKISLYLTQLECSLDEHKQFYEEEYRGSTNLIYSLLGRQVK